MQNAARACERKTVETINALRKNCKLMHAVNRQPQHIQTIFRPINPQHAQNAAQNASGKPTETFILLTQMCKLMHAVNRQPQHVQHMFGAID